MGLYQPDPPIVYIADGSNKCQSVEVRQSLRSILGRSLQICHFKQQVAIDQCGSSALIALELARGHKLGRVPKELAPDKLAKSVRRLHPIARRNMLTIRDAIISLMSTATLVPIIQSLIRRYNPLHQEIIQANTIILNQTIT